MLEEIILPTTITVHLGRPTASAQNVTIGFVDYIKNVASSEIYPTWPGKYLVSDVSCLKPYLHGMVSKQRVFL